jgi:hypothetical protein
MPYLCEFVNQVEGGAVNSVATLPRRRAKSGATPETLEHVR